MPKYRLSFKNKNIIIESRNHLSEKKLTKLAKNYCKKKYGIIVENFLMSSDKNDIMFILDIDGEEELIHVNDYNSYEDLLGSISDGFYDGESIITVKEIENGPDWLHKMITTSSTDMLRKVLFNFAKEWINFDEEEKNKVDGFIELNDIEESESLREVLSYAEDYFVEDINGYHGDSIEDKFRNWVMEIEGEDSDEYGNYIPRNWDRIVRDYDIEHDVSSNGLVFRR